MYLSSDASSELFFIEVVFLPTKRPSSSAGCKGPSSLALLLSITVTGTHTYGTLLPSYLISTSALKLLSLPQLRLCISSVPFCVNTGVLQSTLEQISIIQLCCLWCEGVGCRKLLSILNLILSHFTKAFLYIQKGKLFLSASRLSNWRTIGCQTRNEVFPPLRVRYVFPPFSSRKPYTNLLIIFSTLLSFPL